MNARIYAAALRESLEGKTASEQGKVLTKFLKYVKARRHEKLLPGILASLKKGGTEKGKETLIVGRKKDVVAARKAAGTKVGATIDPNLVGGWQHFKDGVLTDASYKRSLMELYRNITK
tara:strand:- start:1662 stop:2018 length:357 start_codon:yes stop_codon:yes gene_type:complete